MRRYPESCRVSFVCIDASWRAAGETGGSVTRGSGRVGRFGGAPWDDRIHLPCMRLGRFDLHLASDGTFRLDGGAMFGVVPKTLWEKAKRPDEKNRILMGTNCPLIQDGNDLVLVDTGLGDKQDAKFQAIYDFEQGAVRLPESIARLGF